VVFVLEVRRSNDGYLKDITHSNSVTVCMEGIFRFRESDCSDKIVTREHFLYDR